MAYPTIDKPYGLKPVNLLGGQVYSGSTRQIPIASGHGTAIFYGDVVIMATSGCITNATLTSNTVNVVGVFQGCSYINTQGQRVFSQYFPAGTTGTPDSSDGIVAYVADDPDLVMKTVIVTAGTPTIPAQATRANLVGGTIALVANLGLTSTGDSQQAVLNSAGTTTTAPFKIIDVVSDTAPATGSFVEVLVTWNQGVHQYRSNSGVA
jgi:hypothetical protein